MNLDFRRNIEHLKANLKSLYQNPLIASSPFLFSILFYLRQYQNSFKIIPVYELVLSAIIITLITLVLILISFLFVNSNEKGAIITCLFLIIMFFYTDIFALFAKANMMAIASKRPHTVMIIVLAVFLLTFSTIIIRSQRRLHRSNLYFSILACVLILIQLGEINFLNRVLEIDYKKYLLNNVENQSSTVHQNTRRDIYFIVLDSYTSSNSLKEFWGYDNASFINYLKKRGFFVGENSVSPYTWTGQSIASALNMSYIDNNIKTVPGGVRSYVTYQMIDKNRVTTFLKQRGYKLVNLSLFDFSNTQRYYTYPEIMSGDSSFSVGLYNKTLLGFIKQKWIIPDFSNINLSIINMVKKAATSHEDNQPKFVYAHLMMPHWPYQFDRNGNITTGEKLRGQWNNKDKYLDQLIYTNYLITDVVDTILSNYSTKPIIIIQGDHGFRLLEGKDKDKESHTILNAYLLPDGGNEKLYHFVTPVNSFRLVFNQYFGMHYQLMEDADIMQFPDTPPQQ